MQSRPNKGNKRQIIKLCLASICSLQKREAKKTKVKSKISYINSALFNHTVSCDDRYSNESHSGVLGLLNFTCTVGCVQLTITGNSLNLPEVFEESVSFSFSKLGNNLVCHCLPKAHCWISYSFKVLRLGSLQIQCVLSLAIRLHDD